MKTQILFTHNDLDGAGCAIVFNSYWKLVGNPHTMVIYCANGEADIKVREFMSMYNIDDCEIYFADICCSESMLAELIERCMVRVFDHHVSNKYAYKILGSNPSVCCVEEEYSEYGELRPACGSLHLMMYLESRLSADGLVSTRFSVHWSRIKYLTELIRLWDTWGWQDSAIGSYSEAINTFLYIVGIERFVEYFQWWVIDNLNSSIDIPEDMINIMIMKIEEEDDRIEKICKSKDIHVCNIGGKTWSVYNIIGIFSLSISKMADHYLSENPNVDVFAFVINSISGTTVQLRTQKPDINLAEIAMELGGGGHPKAAGFILKNRREKNLALVNDAEDHVKRMVQSYYNNREDSTRRKKDGNH